MQTTKIVCFLSILLFLIGSLCTVDALVNPSVSFQGVGVTINLTFPQEAHPLDNISHNITITANSTLTIQNFNITIYAPVNSSMQIIKSQTLTSQHLVKNQSFTNNLGLILPLETNGTLYCFIYLLTDHSADYFSTTFYTTKVSVLTFTEMQSIYNDLMANYTILQSDYAFLLQDYNDLLTNYSSLLTDYATLQNNYNSLSTNYDNSVATYKTLLNTYNSQLADYNTLNSKYQVLLNKDNALQLDWDLLNSTRYSIQTSYDSLNATYTSLNQTSVDLESQIDDLNQRINDSKNDLNIDKIVMGVFIVILVCLIILIAYMKKKETKPYLVIRKETVALKPDQDQH